jgi:hypothetical protein
MLARSLARSLTVAKLQGALCHERGAGVVTEVQLRLVVAVGERLRPRLPQAATPDINHALPIQNIR